MVSILCHHILSIGHFPLLSEIHQLSRTPNPSLYSAFKGLQNSSYDATSVFDCPFAGQGFENSGPGFWTGMGTGGIFGYLFGSSIAATLFLDMWYPHLILHCTLARGIIILLLSGGPGQTLTWEQELSGYQKTIKSKTEGKYWLQNFWFFFTLCLKKVHPVNTYGKGIVKSCVESSYITKCLCIIC